MAARTITSRRERCLTLFVIPLMSCSARLPVYALLLTFLIRGGAAWKSGLLLASFYFASMFVGALASAVATRFLKKDEDSHFMLELPIYRKPLLKNVLHSALHRTSAYLRRAGPTIFVFSLLIWIATTFPNYNLEDQTARLQQSYAAKIGRVLEPVFHPMGGDWRVGVGLISAFAAREVFVSSMAIVFNVTEKEESSLQNSLIQKMDEAKQSDGYPLFTLSSVVGLVIFFMIAMQCLSTFSMAVRESGSWGFAIFQLIVFNLVAYICAVAAVQGLRALGFA